MTDISKAEFEQLVRRHLKYLDPGEELDFDAELRTLGLDSMAALNLLFDLEDAFEVMLPEEYLVDETFATARSLHDALATVGAAA
jgi:acyl carrier protein